MERRKAAIGKILRQLCEWKGVKIIEAEAVSGSRPSARRDTAEDGGIKLHGIPERKE